MKHKVTFPVRSYGSQLHNIVIDGVVSGWAIRNCQYMWHFKYRLTPDSPEEENWFPVYVSFNEARSQVRAEIISKL